MFFEYSIESERNLVRTRCEGPFAITELIEEMDRVIVDLHYRRGMDMLGDYRMAEWVGEAGSMTDYLDYSERMRDQRGEFRSAVLVAKKDDLELVSMFDLVARQRGIGVETKGFGDEAKAMAWLAESSRHEGRESLGNTAGS